MNFGDIATGIHTSGSCHTPLLACVGMGLRAGFDAAVAGIAREQRGLITSEQLGKLGATPAVIQWRVAEGRWTKVYPRVYRIDGYPHDWHQDLLAACLATSGCALASHRAGALVWGLPSVEPGRLEVMVGRERWHRLPGVACHQTLDLPEADRTIHDGIPVTTIERTLVDLGRYLKFGALEEAVDDALHRGLTTFERFAKRAVELDRPGRRGRRVIRVVLSARDPLARVPESIPERRLLRALRRRGLPDPVLQFDILDGKQFVARVDAAYPNRRLAIEYDSYEHHSGRRQHERDLARRNRLHALGWHVLHATAADLRNPTALVEAIRVSLAA